MLDTDWLSGCDHVLRIFITKSIKTTASTAMSKNNKKCNLVIARQKANRKKNHYFTALHEIRNAQTLIEIEEQTCFSTFAGRTSVILELVCGLLAFPGGSPLAGAGGCSASKTAFTNVNPTNLVGQSLPRIPQFPCIGSWLFTHQLR